MTCHLKPSSPCYIIGFKDEGFDKLTPIKTYIWCTEVRRNRDTDKDDYFFYTDLRNELVYANDIEKDSKDWKSMIFDTKEDCEARIKIVEALQ